LRHRKALEDAVVDPRFILRAGQDETFEI
jgi:hypothetical protein